MTVQRGVCIAFDDATLEPAPTWTSLNDYHDAGLRVQQWQIDRGRQYETEKMNTGTATITIKDFGGVMDMTNGFGPFAGKILPLKQIAIFLTNPETGVESSRFRGFIADVKTVMDPSLKFMTHTISAVDALDIFANAEVIPDSSGDTVPGESVGDVFYEDGPVNNRILAALADAGWPSALAVVFSGNVQVQETIYSAQSTFLAVIQDAADAEFPGVANFYISKDGIATFHGRYARFNPDDVSYGISKWKAGTGDFSAVDPTHVALIAGLEWEINKDSIYNACLPTPQKIKDSDIPGQMVTDPTSIGIYGVRSLPLPNLITKAGEEAGTPLDANDEVKQFGTYYVNNYKQPRIRVTQIEFKTRRDSDPARGAWWKLVCGVDLNDIVTLQTTHDAGGGFSDDFFVEGIHETATPLRNDYPDIDLTLDVSPRSYFANSYPNGPG